MLWVDRVGNRRSKAILARNFSEKNGTGTKRTKETGFTSGVTERRNNDKNGNETMLNMNRALL